MKHNNFWKRTAAGLLALLIVAGYTPLANVGGGGLFDRIAITANAATYSSIVVDGLQEGVPVHTEGEQAGGHLEG